MLTSDRRTSAGMFISGPGCGMLVAGSATPDMGLHSPTAAAVRTWMWLHKNRADNREVVKVVLASLATRCGPHAVSPTALLLGGLPGSRSVQGNEEGTAGRGIGVGT